MKLATTLLALLATPVAAQLSLYNLSIPKDVICTAVDWQGRPVLSLVRWGAGSMFRLYDPIWDPPFTPSVEVTILGVGVLDSRACASSGTYWLQPDGANQFLTCPLSPSGMYFNTIWANPVKIDGRRMTGNSYAFQSAKSPGAFLVRGTSCQDWYPEGACIVVSIVLR